MGNTSTGVKPTVQHLVVDEHSAGQRIDNFLVKILKGVPKARIYRSIRGGEVRVNKGRIKPNYRLLLRDQVRVPPIRTADRVTLEPSTTVLTAIERAIIYEDDRLILLNKPAGVAVHGGSGVSHGVIEALRKLRGEHDFLELVHRLDRDTSGCLMVAKRRRHLLSIQDLIRRNNVRKIYWLLCRGFWKDGNITVDLPLTKNTLRSGERVVRVDPAGKPALTHFRLLDANAFASLSEARLITGRTHQIRVHASAHDAPIAGDEKYGDKTFNQQCRSQGLNRMFLHASSIQFTLDDQRYDLSCPLPDTLSDFLAHHGLSQSSK